MRVRAMTPSGDMRFGNGTADFLINTPAAVAQLAMTRLALWTGQWFLDFTEGTPYATQILGFHTQSVYDNALITRLLGTTGVVSLSSYQSQLDASTRRLTYSAVLNTQFGQATVVTAEVVVPPSPSNQLRDDAGNLLFDDAGNPLFSGP